MIYLNGSPINVTIFPDKTSQVWKLPEEILKTTNYARVTWDYESEAEFMHLAQLKYLLDVHGFKTDLKISYLPYARQDKLPSNNSTFALYPFSNLLNSLKFDNITIIDPHSKIATEIINNSNATYPIKQLQEALLNTWSNNICYPDKGALDKYSTTAYKETVGNDYFYGEKVRNQDNGDIISYKLIGEFKNKNKNVMIVDDICDGGATFILLTKELYKAGAKEVNLFVTHGLFTKGIQVLKDAGINRIFTKDGECT